MGELLEVAAEAPGSPVTAGGGDQQQLVADGGRRLCRGRPR
jgi:hypothetical protein